MPSCPPQPAVVPLELIVPDSQRMSEVQTEFVRTCYLCQSEGAYVHEGMKDFMGNASGEWAIRRCVNGACGLMWLDPRLSPKDLSKAYASYYTHTDSAETAPDLLRRAYAWLSAGYLYDRFGYRTAGTSWYQRVLAKAIWLAPAQRENLDFSVMYLPRKEHGTLLEIGCGSGRMLRQMQGLGWTVQGIDLDPGAVANAAKKGLKVTLGELESCGYPNASFDAITMNHLIEHVYSPRSLLAECYRIVKPGGRVVVVTPNIESIGHRLFGKHWRGLEPPRHIHLFSVDALTRLGAEVGYGIVSARTTVHGAQWAYRASRHIKALALGTTKSQLGDAVLPHLLQHLEWLALWLNPTAGSEMAVVFEKGCGKTLLSAPAPASSIFEARCYRQDS
jgi:2-polyprenyl-3-methyl-5-hydroxy-6-metoxy-1,4-benzoquinol methylase